MKASIKKLIALIACLCLVLPSAVLIATAEDSSVTISFADKANRTSYSTSQQVWKQNGITVTNDKGASTSNVGDYANPGRFYKSSTVTIEYPGMTTIVIDSVTYADNDYAAPWANSITDANATATVSDGDVTIVFAHAVDSFTWETMAAQGRAYAITVYTDGGAPVVPDEPDVPSEDPEVDTELTIADAIALGLSKEHNVYTEGKYFVTGVITEVYNTQYGNMYITDGNGNTLTIYGTYDADGTNRYDAMDVKPVAGDTITVYGIVGQYNNVAQIKNGWIVEHTAAGGETPDEPDEPEQPTGDKLTIAEAIALGLAQDHNVFTEQKYYVSGVITEVYNDMYGNMRLTDADGNILTIYGSYDADGTNRYDAMDVKPVAGDTITVYGIVGQYNGTPQVKNGWIVEHTAAGGETPDEPDEPEQPTGDKLTIAEAIALGLAQDHNVFTEQKYYVSGVITEVYNDMYGNMRLTDADGNILTIYGTYDADGTNRYDAMDVKPVAGDTITVYGIVGQYNGTPQVKNGWIVEHTAAGGETPDEPEEPEEPEQPSAPTVGVVTNPEAGVAYKLGLDQIEKGSVYYFTGEMSSYYGATDTDVAKAVDMYLENAEGGYKLYFTDASGAKQYIKLEQSGTHYNFTFGAEGSVFTLDAEKNALCAPCGDQICYMGTYGSYVTVGTLTSEKLQDSDYIARLYAVTTETPDEPEQPGENDSDSPATGDNSTAYVTLAVALMVLAAAVAVLTSKKRA